MGSNVELVWPESEAYSSRVNNCSHANSSLAAIRAKLSAEQLEQFKTSCFGHLLNIDKIQFSGQIVHGVVLRRVAGQGVKDLDGLSFLIGCDVAQFTRQDFCLITGLRFGENHIHTCFADNKRKKEQVGWKIRSSLVNVVNGKVPACGLDWQHTYKVYVPCMLPKYKHWVALEIDLIQCEIKVYDSMVSLIPDESLKEELGPLSITIPNLLNTLDFYEEGVYANECTRDWWCPWPIHRVDVPQQANEGDCGMFVLKYIELLTAEIPLATYTAQHMPFFRLKLAAEIARGDAYMP
ncbi:unnamed protein product [Prunus brigantina]